MPATKTTKTTKKQQHHLDQAEQAKATADRFRAVGDPGNCAPFFDKVAKVHAAMAAK